MRFMSGVVSEVLCTEDYANEGDCNTRHYALVLKSICMLIISMFGTVHVEQDFTDNFKFY